MIDISWQGTLPPPPSLKGFSPAFCLVLLRVFYLVFDVPVVFSMFFVGFLSMFFFVVFSMGFCVLSMGFFFGFSMSFWL